MSSKQGSPRPQKLLWPADRHSGQSCHMETRANQATLSVILRLFHLSALTMCWSSACKQIVRPRFTLVHSLSLLKDSLLLFFSPAQQSRLDKIAQADETPHTRALLEHGRSRGGETEAEREKERTKDRKREIGGREGGRVEMVLPIGGSPRQMEKGSSPPPAARVPAFTVVPPSSSTTQEEMSVTVPLCIYMCGAGLSK
ncbi:hypothetical protein E1301_Tti020306 [Triplophysa tibetana]|uniref:Uncharacterized protein n=1 Tax=Triplophysa tibetana TaxID=1572043 RepID=A0A5A9NYC2_9TELE|nr:hypothetical protein E1301_Tti020306 [Triplophysa tibetana]